MDVIGAMRRIQALAVLGRPLYTVANSINTSQATVRQIAAGTRTSVAKDMAAAVTELYTKWMTCPGPSEVTRCRAKANGWHGPLVWDDIDNPDEAPEKDTGAAGDGGKYAQARITAEEIQHLAKFGLSEHEIAARVGHDPRYVHDQVAGHRAPAWRQRKRALAA